MKRAHCRHQGNAALELIEEATHLLRLAPAGTLATYYLGSLPFILGLLYFWADMSRSAFANQHLIGAALSMALLFLWMKFWQVIFARRVRSQIAGDVLPRWNARRALRVCLIQTALQPSALFLLPLCALPVLPFPWVYAFYQNVTALTDGETDGIKKVFEKSCRQAWVWPKQNWLVLTFLFLFGLYVFLNLVTACLALPHLLKMLFGIESVFTQSPFSMLNTTFFAAMFGLTYLCVDPILKTVYALRCFYGESLESGEDLKTELRSFAPTVQQMAATLALLLSLVCASRLNAADAATEPASPTQTSQIPSAVVSAPELDRKIDGVIRQRKYSWRMPREKIEEESAQKGFLARFFERVGKLLRKWARAVWHWLEDLFDRLFNRHRGGGKEKSGFGWFSSQGLIFVLVVVVVCALALLLVHFWRQRKQKAVVQSEAIFPIPDITDENVGAEQLPEDGWITMGRELLGRGELRLAMRAFYLASLAHLAARNMISLAKFKSNRDYERELQRRGHSLPDLLSLFGENVSVFDRIWYGLHEVNTDTVNQFLTNVERIKTTG